MPLDHYLPATYLAAFSSDANPERRERRLWAVDKRTGRLFRARASKICAIRDFYTTGTASGDPWLVDSAWAGYESQLSNAINEMIADELDALVWLNTLVVFVAALMVRGGDFDERYVSRLGDLANKIPYYGSREHTNQVRLFELQRLFASVIGANWRLLETSGNVMQITNDIGYAPFFDPLRKETGIAIPVGPRHILIIAPTLKRMVVVAQEGRWRPCIERATLGDQNHSHFLDSIAGNAQRFVIGPDPASIDRYAVVQSAPSTIPEPADLGFFGGALARYHEMIYFRMVAQLSVPPDGSVPAMIVDYEKNGPA